MRLLGRAPRLTDLIVRRPGVEAIQERASGRGYYRYLVVVPSEGSYRLHGVEPHEGDEFHKRLTRSTKQFDAAIPRDLALGDSMKDFGAEKVLIGISVRWSGPPVPDPADHRLGTLPSSISGQVGIVLTDALPLRRLLNCP
jgi:hypothetical protein